jgi:hypothetical protein
VLNRFEPILKILCVALAALLLFQGVRSVLHGDPLGNASIPSLPTLSIPVEAKKAPVDPVAKTATVATNSVAKQKAGDTNAVAQGKAPKPKHRRNFGSRMGGPAEAMNLPPPIQTRVDLIKESEILGPFIRPLPLALLGIADDDAFLRAPDGQTGLVKEGGELGGIKLLRIGINRVLVEQAGEKKELTLFDGFGSDSLLPAVTDTPTNAITMPNQKENP